MKKTGPIRGDSLTIWQAIWRAIDEQHLSRAAVARMVEGQITRDMVYKYLNGTHDLSTDRASILMDLLGLGVGKVKPGTSNAR